MIISLSELEGLVHKALRKKYDEEDTKLIEDVILFGQLSGKTSHGIVRLFGGIASVLSMNPTGKPELIKKTKLSTIINGNHNSGVLVAALACNEVIKLAKENGFGIVGTKMSFSSSGSLSYYLEKIATEGLIGIIMAQSPQSTPPYGSIQPLFGTNPLSFAIPSTPQPLIFDMATAAITFGDLVKAKALKKSIPPHVAIDEDGNMTTDPTKAMEGATLPFGNSYKSAGLAMIVEILSGIWPGAGFVGLNKEDGWGNTFIAYSPELMLSTDEFKRKVSRLIKTVRNAKTKDGGEVRIPGERTFQVRDEHLRKGEIDIEEELIRKLRQEAK